MNLRYRALMALFTALMCLTACGVAPDSSQSLDAPAVHDMDNGLAELEPIYKNEEEPTPSPPVELSPADYDALRAEIIASREEKSREEIIGALHYMSSSPIPAFLETDETATLLENYLAYTIFLSIDDAGLSPGYVVDYLYYNAAVRNTAYSAIKKGLPEKYANYDLRSVFFLKEDIDAAAKLLFGEETVIEYSVIKAQQGQFWYHHLSGTASFERYVIEGEAPIVIDYTDLGNHYEVTVTFQYWSNWFEDDEFGAMVDGKIIKLNGKETAIDYYLNQSPRYTVRIDKGEDGLLYFKSMDKIV